MSAPSIAVFGGAHLDRRGRLERPSVPGASNPGRWFEEAGGGGFNAARNLARLGAVVRMIAPRGGDAEGALVTGAAEAAGVIDCPFVFLDRKTPSYTAILEADGNLVIALADMDLYRMFSPRRLRQTAIREILAQCDMVVMDANLPEETIAALSATARAQGKRLAGIAVSPAKVVRYQRSLQAFDILFMNRAEACALAGREASDPHEWPDLLRAAGLAGGVVTAGPSQTIAFDRDRALGIIPPDLSSLADVTGAGDALAAGFLSALIGGAELSLSLRTGIAAAGITVRSPLAVSEKMNAAHLAQALALVPEPRLLA